MDIAEQLRELEEMLLSDAVRKNSRLIASLLADEFREYGISGQIYSKAETIDALRSETPVLVSLFDFEFAFLSTTIALVTYRASKSQAGFRPAESLRSSIWVLREERWQLLFHQGTRAFPTTPEY